MVICKNYQILDPNSNFDPMEVSASACRTFIILRAGDDGEEGVFIEPDLLPELIEVLQSMKAELV